MNMNISGENVKRMRLERGWTQEDLATLSGRNVRTIQRVEKSGICDLETRSALAAVFKLDATQLDGTKKIEQAKRADGDRLIYYSRLTTGSEIVKVIDGSDMYRFTNEEPKTSEDAAYISHVVGNIHDHIEIWSDIDPGDRVRITYELSEMSKEMETNGFKLFGLRTKCQTQVGAGDERQRLDMKVASFHVAYTNNNAIVALDPRS